MTFRLTPLPFAIAALEPYISGHTMSCHYGKHHAGYVKTLNKLTKGTAFADRSLEDVIRTSVAKVKYQQIFNSAAQVWNHEFFWNSICPGGPTKPAGRLAKLLTTEIGNKSDVVRALVDAGQKQFGSGWVWLVAKANHLKVIHSANADLPWTDGYTPLLTIDVWEHAYYLDYENRRPSFLGVVAQKLLNWEFAAQNLAAMDSH
jgi:Fe-Mn family superoxide dismutase